MIDPYLHAVAGLKTLGAKGEDVGEIKLITIAGPPCPVEIRSPGATFVRPAGIEVSVYARPVGEGSPLISLEEAATITSADLLASGLLERESWKVIAMSSDFVPQVQYEATIRMAAPDLSEHRNMIWEWMFGSPTCVVVHLAQMDLFRADPQGDIHGRAAMLLASRLAVEPPAVRLQFAAQLGVDGSTTGAMVGPLRKLSAGGPIGDAALAERMLTQIRADIVDTAAAELAELAALPRSARLKRLASADTEALATLARRLIATKELEASALLLTRSGLTERIDFACSAAIDDAGVDNVAIH